MDIEELQKTWTQMSEQLEKQKKLTDSLILQMTQQRYSKKFNTLMIFESFGTVICFILAIFVMIQIEKLDTWYLLTCGIITLAFLWVMPILTLRSLWKIRHIDIHNKNVKETLITFTNSRKRVLAIQQIGIFGGFLLFFTSMPVASKLLSGKDFFMREQPLWFYPFVFLVALGLFFFARWGYGGYKRVTESAGKILQELE